MKAVFYRPATWIVVGISVVAVLLYALSSIDALSASPSVTVDLLREKLLGFGKWAAVISGSLMMLQSVIPPLPSNVITITNGLLFGPVWGALLSWSSGLMGASACFFLSRRVGKPFARRLAGESLHCAESFFKKYGMQAVFLVRIVPFVPFDAVSYAAGLLGVPFPRFLLASGIGLIPSVLIYTFIGPIVLASHGWLLLVGLCVMAGCGALLVRWFSSSQLSAVSCQLSAAASGRFDSRMMRDPSPSLAGRETSVGDQLSAFSTVDSCESKGTSPSL